MKCRVALQVAAGFLLAAGVDAAPPPGFMLAAETRHFTFFSRRPEKVDAARSERFLLATSERLGQPAPEQVAYYLHEHPQQVAQATGVYADGVTVPATGEIHSVRSFHPHELVHRVAGEMGDPGRFFHEGLAVALGNEGRWRGAKVDDLARRLVRRCTWRALLERFESLDPEVGYPLAGSFVAFLIERHGVDRVSAFFRGCRPETAGRRFEDVFGLSLDQAGAAWVRGLSR